ncbi:hypothetical protein EV121DRAFT_291163 [Schizophyllum commune]
MSSLTTYDWDAFASLDALLDGNYGSPFGVGIQDYWDVGPQQGDHNSSYTASSTLSPFLATSVPEDDGSALDFINTPGVGFVASSFPTLGSHPSSPIIAQSPPVDTPASSITPLVPTRRVPRHTVRPLIGTPARAEATAARRRAPDSHWCHQCNKGFTRRYNLKDHNRRHMNEQAYACTILCCEARFNTQSDLRSHVRNCHGNGER